MAKALFQTSKNLCLISSLSQAVFKDVPCFVKGKLLHGIAHQLLHKQQFLSRYFKKSTL